MPVLSFVAHFRNVSLILDCVSCEKCKLWGKLQILGIGTALKVLMSEAAGAAYDLERYAKPTLKSCFVVRVRLGHAFVSDLVKWLVTVLMLTRSVLSLRSAGMRSSRCSTR